MLQRHDVAYYACPKCGLVCTERPHWLQEAYANPIAPTDIGLVARNRALVRPTTLVLAVLCNGGGRFLDFGGGNGLFVRMMRDTGFDFRWLDPWTQNLFARGFEHHPGGRYEAVTAFEVFEHLPEPRETLGELAAITDTILISTEILPAPRPQPEAWWYYALESGQHVTLYTVKALEALGAAHGLQLHTNGINLHLLTRRKITRGLFACLVRPLVARVLQPLVGRRASLLPADFTTLTGRHLDR
ncbi:MAG: class I SAM-dependent methyltransferase [Verrucomicrobia bacterium]|nr:class I SAM-dependent methyltransferase [Verrucomicrobiota bacterium]